MLMLRLKHQSGRERSETSRETETEAVSRDRDVHGEGLSGVENPSWPPYSISIPDWSKDKHGGIRFPAGKFNLSFLTKFH